MALRIAISVGSISRQSIAAQSIWKRHGTSIPVILLQDIEKQGNKGEVIKVKRGFARNLLIPRKLAVYATELNRSKYNDLASSVRQSAAKVNDTVDIAKLTAYLAANSIVLKKSAVDGSSNLYGSVTTADVIATLSSAGHANISSVEISAHIKTLGDHKIKVEGLDATVTVTAASS